MNSKLLPLLFFALTLNQIQSHAASALNAPLRASDNAINPSVAFKGGDPIDIKVVVSTKRIWFVADEMPMKCLKTKIIDAQGNIVLEKCFSSKCADWFLNIEALPKGDYTLHLGDRVEKFKK